MKIYPPYLLRPYLFYTAPRGVWSAETSGVRARPSLYTVIARKYARPATITLRPLVARASNRPINYDYCRRRRPRARTIRFCVAARPYRFEFDRKSKFDIRACVQLLPCASRPRRLYVIIIRTYTPEYIYIRLYTVPRIRHCTYTPGSSRYVFLDNVDYNLNAGNEFFAFPNRVTRLNDYRTYVPMYALIRYRARVYYITPYFVS